LWQTNRCPVLKTKLKRTLKELKTLLETERNQRIQKYLSELSLSAETDCEKPSGSLNADIMPPIKKQDECWARSDEKKAEAFATHLSKVFESHPYDITIVEEN